MINIDWNAFIKLPYWLAKPLSELDKFRVGCIAFWQRVNEILAWPGAQLDPMTAELALVHLLAWERDIEQIPQETEQLYRIRVKYALKFAKGAGSIDGWHFMFKKLGVQILSIDERIEFIDWDIIRVQLIDSELSQSSQLIENIIRQYGRTCRRYELAVHNKVNAFLKTGNTLVQHDHTHITSPTQITGKNRINTNIKFGFINKISGISIAKETP